MQTRMVLTIIFTSLFSLSLLESTAQSDRPPLPLPFQPRSEAHEVEAIGASARVVYMIKALPIPDGHNAIADLQILRPRDAVWGFPPPTQPWDQSAFDFAVKPSKPALYPTIMSPSHQTATADTAERLDLQWTRSIGSPQ